MSDKDIIVFAVAMAASLLSAGFTWVIARRRMSGNVRTTDADRLWSQNDKLIDAYQQDNAHLRERITKQDERLAVQDAKIWELTLRERECDQRNAELTRKMERLERALQLGGDLDLGQTAGGV